MLSFVTSNFARSHVGDRQLLGSAYAKARAALQDEACLSDDDLDALSDVMNEALLSLLRAGQIDQNKLSHYAVAQTLRHLWAGRR